WRFRSAACPRRCGKPSCCATWTGWTTRKSPRSRASPRGPRESGLSGPGRCCGRSWARWSTRSGSRSPRRRADRSALAGGGRRRGVDAGASAAGEVVGAVERPAEDGLEELFLEAAHLREGLRDGGEGAVMLGEALALDARHVAFLRPDPGELLPFLAEGFPREALAVGGDQGAGASVEELVDLVLPVDLAKFAEEGDGEGAVGLGKQRLGLFGEREEVGGPSDLSFLHAGLDELLAQEHGELLADGGQAHAARLCEAGRVG